MLQIIPNLYAVHHDPDVFPDPDLFDPSRFLDDKGQVTGKDRIIPFGLGMNYYIWNVEDVKLHTSYISLFEKENCYVNIITYIAIIC